jgi:hypothetical protein
MSVSRAGTVRRGRALKHVQPAFNDSLRPDRPGAKRVVPLNLGIWLRHALAPPVGIVN